VRVYLDVGPGGEPRSDFAVRTITAARDAGGTPLVAADVENTGARAVDLAGDVTLADGSGQARAGPFTAAGTTLGIGQRGRVTARLDPRLPGGPWTATVSLRSGTIRHAATARLTFPTRAGTASAAGRTPVRRSAVVLAGLSALLVVAFVLLRVIRSRRGASSAGQSDSSGRASG